jgi:chromosome segregation ATPase
MKSPDDILPVSAFRYSDFDPVLAQEVERVAANQLLQPATKLAQVFKVIVKFHKNQLKDAEARLKAASDDNEKTRATIGQFSVDLSLLISRNTVSYDEFFNHGGAQKIIQQVTQLMQELEEARRTAHEHSALADHVTSLFGNSPDLFAQVGNLREQIDALEQQLKAKRKKNTELRNRVREACLSGAREIEQLTTENAQLQRTIQGLEKKVLDSNSTTRKLQKNLSAAKEQLKAAQLGASDSEQSRTREHQSIIERLQTERSEVETQLTDHISKLNQQIATAVDTIAAHEATISKLQKQVLEGKRVIAEKSEQLSDLEKSKKTEVDELVYRARTEKENLVQTYENTIADLTQQCTGHRKDIESVSRDLSESEARNQKARRLITALKRERLQLQAELESLTAKAQRDSEVWRAKTRHTELTAQSAVKQSVLDERARFENEKRRLLSLAAEEFRGFFNATDLLDERSYRQLLSRVKGEIRRLSDQDNAIRRLVGAAPQQSTDDAVAHLLVE